jgi:hypothetical protein
LQKYRSRCRETEDIVVALFKEAVLSKKLGTKETRSITGRSGLEEVLKYSFGKMFAKWRILFKRMDTGEFNATSVVNAVCGLRNLLSEHKAPDHDYVSIEAEQV